MKDFSALIAQTPKKIGRPKGALTVYKRTPSWEKFATEWLKNGGDEIAAAAHAGFERPTVMGPRLMQRAEVRRMLGLVDGHEPITAKDLTPGLVKQQLARIAKFDPACLYNDDGSAKKLSELTPDQRSALAEVKINAYGTTYRVNDKIKALSLASDVMGLKHQTVSIEHSGSIEHRLNLDSLDSATLREILDIADTLPDETIIDADYTELEE